MDDKKNWFHLTDGQMFEPYSLSCYKSTIVDTLVVEQGRLLWWLMCSLDGKDLLLSAKCYLNRLGLPLDKVHKGYSSIEMVF